MDTQQDIKAPTEEAVATSDHLEKVGVEDILPPGYFQSPLFIGTIFAVGLGLAAAISGFGLVAPILSFINEDIGPDPNIYWVSFTASLTPAIVVTLVGRFTDTFGRRWTFLTGQCCALIGSIIGSQAPSIKVLIGASVFIGVGIGTQASYFYVIAELLPAKYRFVGNAAIYSMAVPTAGFAAAISFASVQNTAPGWRTVYYILIGINALATGLLFLFYHPPTFNIKHHGESKLTYLKSFDYIGLLLFSGGLLIFLLGLNWGGSVYPWSSVRVIVCMVVGAAVFAAFIVWDLFAEDPFVPIRLLANRGWISATLISALGTALYYALAIVWPQMVFVLYMPNDLSRAGLIATVSSVPWVIGELISGAVAKYTGYIRLQIQVGVAIGGILLAAAASCTPDTLTRAACLVAFSTFALGYMEGLSITAVTMIVIDPGQIGAAGGFAQSIRSAIGTIASSVFTVVLTNTLKEKIAARVPAAVTAAGLPASSVTAFLTSLSSGTGMESVPGINPDIIQAGSAAYLSSYATAFRMVFLTSIAFTGVAVVCSLLLPDLDKLMTDQVLTALHNRKDEKKLAELGVVVMSEAVLERAERRQYEKA